MLKWMLVFFVLLLAIGLNLPSNILAQYGLESSLVMAALAAAILAGLIAFRSIGLVLVMVALVIGANLPASVAAGYHLDREILLATLIALIVIPFVQRQLED